MRSLLLSLTITGLFFSTFSALADDGVQLRNITKNAVLSATSDQAVIKPVVRYYAYYGPSNVYGGYYYTPYRTYYYAQPYPYRTYVVPSPVVPAPVVPGPVYGTYYPPYGVYYSGPQVTFGY